MELGCFKNFSGRGSGTAGESTSPVTAAEVARGTGILCCSPNLASDPCHPVVVLSGPAACTGLAACGERPIPSASCGSANRYGLQQLRRPPEANEVRGRGGNVAFCC